MENIKQVREREITVDQVSLKVKFTHEGWNTEREEFPYVLAQFADDVGSDVMDEMVKIFDRAARDLGMRNGVRMFTSGLKQPEALLFGAFIYMSFDELRGEKEVPSDIQMQVLARRIAHDSAVLNCSP